MGSLKDIRGGNVRLRDLPDLAPLRREMDKYREMSAELDSARRRVGELEASRPHAKQVDRAAFAKVLLQKGAKASDQPATEQARLEEEIAKAQTRREAFETALDVAEAKLIEAVKAKRAEMLRDVDGSLAKVGRDYAGAAEKLLALRTQRDELQNVRAWVVGFPEKVVEVRTNSRPFYGIKTMHGSPVSGAVFAKALREDVDDPKPKANVMPIPEADPLVAA
jgi:hypothetical protein